MSQIPKVDNNAATSDPIGGVKKDAITCDVVLFFSSFGIFYGEKLSSEGKTIFKQRTLNARAVSQNEQMRRYNARKA